MIIDGDNGYAKQQLIPTQHNITHLLYHVWSLCKYYKLKELVLTHTTDPTFAHGSRQTSKPTIDWTTISKKMNRKYLACQVRATTSRMLDCTIRVHYTHYYISIPVTRTDSLLHYNLSTTTFISTAYHSTRGLTSVTSRCVKAPSPIRRTVSSSAEWGRLWGRAAQASYRMASGCPSARSSIASLIVYSCAGTEEEGCRNIIIIIILHHSIHR